MKYLIDIKSLSPPRFSRGAFRRGHLKKQLLRPAVVCDYSLDEMRRVFNKKFPHKLSVFDRFVAIMMLSVQIM